MTQYRARYINGTIEEWRPIPSFPGYSASSFGSIRRDARVVIYGKVQRVPDGKPLTPRLMNKRSGPWGVTLSCAGEAYHRLVHRLVAEAFLGPAPEGLPFVCHIDGDPSHNRPENLRWGNGTTNAADRTRHGRTLRGERVGNSKLTPESVLAIRSAHAGGESQRATAQRFGVSQSLVSMIVHRKIWGHI